MSLGHFPLSRNVKLHPPYDCMKRAFWFFSAQGDNVGRKGGLDDIPEVRGCLRLQFLSVLKAASEFHSFPELEKSQPQPRPLARATPRDFRCPWKPPSLGIVHWFTSSSCLACRIFFFFNVRLAAFRGPSLLAHRRPRCWMLTSILTSCFPRKAFGCASPETAEILSL